MNNSRPVMSLKHIKKSFHQGHDDLNILTDVSLDIEKGKIYSIVGPSGCGKSTLMHIAGLLDHPDSGAIKVAGTPCSDANERLRTRLRRKHLGFVYQYHHLLSEFSAVENIMLPQIIAGTSKRKAITNARKILDQFGLIDRHDHRPAELSGGEQQRVAIARALANQPKILLADEPTGNLDPHTADEVFEVMLKQVKKRELAVLMVTHNAELAGMADETFLLEDGILKQNEN